jgi:hypothetical protein
MGAKAPRVVVPPRSEEAGIPNIPSFSVEANSPSSNLIARNEDAYLQMLANAFYGLSVLHSVETGSEEVVPPLTFGKSPSE